MNETTLPYLLQKYQSALRRAKTYRDKAAISKDSWHHQMARAAEKDAAKCFAKWRRENPSAPRPVIPE